MFVAFLVLGCLYADSLHDRRVLRRQNKALEADVRPLRDSNLSLPEGAKVHVHGAVIARPARRA